MDEDLKEIISLGQILEEAFYSGDPNLWREADDALVELLGILTFVPKETIEKWINDNPRLGWIGGHWEKAANSHSSGQVTSP